MTCQNKEEETDYYISKIVISLFTEVAVSKHQFFLKIIKLNIQLTNSVVIIKTTKTNAKSFVFRFGALCISFCIDKRTSSVSNFYYFVFKHNKSIFFCFCLNRRHLQFKMSVKIAFIFLLFGLAKLDLCLCLYNFAYYCFNFNRI